MYITPKQQRNLIENIKLTVRTLMLQESQEHDEDKKQLNWDELSRKKKANYYETWFVEKYGMRPQQFASLMYDRLVNFDNSSVI